MRLEPRRAGAVVEIVAEAEHPPRAGRADRQRQAIQRLAAVVGRQHLAMAGEEACLFEMEVGDQQRAFARPEQRAALQQQRISC